MDKDKSIKLFEQKTIRTHWNEVQEKWFFSTQDVVEVLTDTPNPKDYIKKMKRRDEELAIERALETHLKKGYSQDWIN